MGRSLSQRLTHIISTQDWDPLSNTLWLRQAVQLLLATAEPQQLLAMPTAALQLPILRIFEGGTDVEGSKILPLLAAHREFLCACHEGGARKFYVYHAAALSRDYVAPHCRSFPVIPI